MKRQELEKDMREAVGGAFITKKQLASFMGYSKVDSIKKYLIGLEKVGVKYYVPDVARRISNEVK